MMKRIRAALPLAAALCLATSIAWAQEISIKLAHSLSTSEPAHQAAEYFAKNVGERTHGQVKITVFPGEQLGTGKEVNQMIRQGANVMNITDPGYLSDFVPDVGILNGPYLLNDPLQFKKILASDWYRDIDKRLQKAGFRVISFNNFFGGREMLADKPIREPADIKGLTVRVPPNQMWIETFRAMGARPATVEWSEVYNALSQNVVAAAEAPLGSLYGSKLYETRKTISMTNHFLAWVAFIISEQYFEHLPKEVQQILLEEGEKAGDYMTKLTMAQQDKYIADFRKQGVTIVTDVDVPAFRQATESVYKAFPKWTPGLYEKIEAILNH